MMYQSRTYTYKVTHRFVVDDGSEVPEDIKKLTPIDQTGKINGEIVHPSEFDKSDRTGRKNGVFGIWKFVGWEKNQDTINKADVEFVGVWTFSPYHIPSDPTDPDQPNPDNPNPENLDPNTHGNEQPTNPNDPINPSTPDSKNPNRPKDGLPNTGVDGILSIASLSILGLAGISINRKRKEDK